MFEKLLQKYRRRKYRVGRTLAGTVAFDVEREVKILSADRIDEGFITAEIKTINVLYEAYDIEQPDAEPQIVELHIKDLWNWTGNDWGGLSDGSSVLTGEIKSND